MPALERNDGSPLASASTAAPSSAETDGAIATATGAVGGADERGDDDGALDGTDDGAIDDGATDDDGIDDGVLDGTDEGAFSTCTSFRTQTPFSSASRTT